MFYRAKWCFALTLVGMFLFSNIDARAQCSADFSYNLIACNTFQFTDMSTPAPGYFLYGWEWDFGDGFTSALPNPVHFFNTGGFYNVTLTFTADSLSYLCTDAITYTVQVPNIPTVYFTWDPDLAQIGELISFFGASGSQITSWAWDFDDGIYGYGQNIEHSYYNEGDYMVTLTVTDINGCSSELSQAVTVGINPAVDFFFSSPCLNEPVQFTVDASVTDIGAVTVFHWDFGDGASSTNQNPSHTYSTTGNYEVTLIITDTLGLSNSVSHEVELYPLPAANFQFIQTCLGDVTQFIDYSSCSSGYITTWEWDFGDGTTQTVNFPDDPDVEHIYTTSASFSVVLTVTTSDGCQNTVIRTVQISESPVAEFTWQDACYGSPVLFTDLSSTNGGELLLNWEWDFGDSLSGSNHSYEMNPSHVFSVPGDFTVTLTVTNYSGCVDTVSHDLTVDELPDVSMTISNDHPDINEPVQFMGVSSSNISSWYWDFGDGGLALTQNPEYIYNAYGQYVVSLTVTGFDGCQNETNQLIHVYPPPFFPDSNAIWNTIGVNNLLNANWHFRYGLMGDTLMSTTKDSFVYHKIYQLDDTTLTTANSTYFGAIRSTADKKVFVKLPDLPESLLYDYALEVGDTAWFAVGGVVCEEQPEFWEESHYKVVSLIDSVMLLNNEYRNRWHFQDGDTWIEGLGSVEWFGLFNPIVSTRAYCGDEYGFACFKQDDVALYINQPDCETCFCDMLLSIEEPIVDLSTLNVFPNPARETVVISMENKTIPEAQVNIYNSNGRLVFHSYNRILKSISVDVGNWTSGLYVVLVKGKNGSLTKASFVVE